MVGCGQWGLDRFCCGLGAGKPCGFAEEPGLEAGQSWFECAFIPSHGFVLMEQHAEFWRSQTRDGTCGVWTGVRAVGVDGEVWTVGVDGGVWTVGCGQ